MNEQQVRDTLEQAAQAYGLVADDGATRYTRNNQSGLTNEEAEAPRSAG